MFVNKNATETKKMIGACVSRILRFSKSFKRRLQTLNRIPVGKRGVEVLCSLSLSMIFTPLLHPEIHQQFVSWLT